MLFDPQPKEDRRSLFNFEEEVNRVISELKDPISRLIVIKGLRRTGKSSILRVSLNEAKLNYILLDMREFADVDRRSFMYALSESLDKMTKGRGKLILDNIRAFSFLGMRIEKSGLKEEDPTIKYKLLLRRINEWAMKNKTYFVVGIDEAQEISKINFDEYLAYVYDNLSRIKIILTGSQFGVLDNILDNPKKPLFGRARIEINTKYLSKEESKRFLASGFKEANIEVEDNDITKAINQLNGVIGWLTLYGWHVVKGLDPEEALEKVVELGTKIAFDEIERFLVTRGIGRKRYMEVLKILADGPKRWKEVKTMLELRLERRVPNNQISKYLNELIKYGFIVKKDNKYLIPDPLLRQVAISKF